jgi:hypothetical protein
MNPVEIGLVGVFLIWLVVFVLLLLGDGRD